MSNPQLPAKSSGMNISPDNPFRDDIIQWQDSMKVATRTSEGDGYKMTQITIIEKSKYYPSKHSKLYHNKLKAILDDISPAGAWLFLYITLNMDFEKEQVKIEQSNMPLSRPTVAKALLDLVSHRIITKVDNKKEWYWVNVTMVVVGNISDPHQWQSPTE